MSEPWPAGKEPAPLPAPAPWDARGVSPHRHRESGDTTTAVSQTPLHPVVWSAAPPTAAPLIAPNAAHAVSEGQPVEVLRGDGTWSAGVVAAVDHHAQAYVVAFSDAAGSYEKRVRMRDWRRKMRVTGPPHDELWPPPEYSDRDPDADGCEPVARADVWHTPTARRSGVPPTAYSTQRRPEQDPYDATPRPISLRRHDPAGDWLRADSRRARDGPYGTSG